MTTTEMTLHPWRALFWEPVSGTGERIMVGVVHGFDSEIQSARIIRDDVLDSLYGTASAAAKKLITAGLSMYAHAGRAGGIEALTMPLLGLYPGPLRATAAISVGDLLRTAALLYSSLSNLDKLDDMDETDTPLAEEVNRRFSTEVRESVAARRPAFLSDFGRTGSLVIGGPSVRFGYFSPKLVAHFSVIHASRQSASVRDARARLWELARAVDVAAPLRAILITAVPRQDDATLGDRQRKQVKENELEIADEAKTSNIAFYAVHTADQGADQLITAEEA